MKIEPQKAATVICSGFLSTQILVPLRNFGVRISQEVYTLPSKCSADLVRTIPSMFYRTNSVVFSDIGVFAILFIPYRFFLGGGGKFSNSKKLNPESATGSSRPFIKLYHVIYSHLISFYNETIRILFPLILLENMLNIINQLDRQNQSVYINKSSKV